MTLVIREAVAGDDLVAAGAIVQQAYFSLPGYPHEPEYDALLGDVAGRMHHARVAFAFLDGRLVGCLTFLDDNDSPHAEHDDDEAASFRYFGVDPSVQGKGVGEAMVRWCIDETRRVGLHRLRIHTLDVMPGAQRLYLRMGFEREPELDEDWDGIIGLAFVHHL
ncbi:MAG: GNAT family N-acetyltransferase [Ilumatobacteraceae bacterium]